MSFPPAGRNDHDRYNLARFLQAQSGTYDRALAELSRGQKTTHWMWFVFPQIAGLGRSEMSQRYAIVSLDEARAYLMHPTLGLRLVECAGIVANTSAPSAVSIFGTIDTEKLRSSMTLFLRADPSQPVFQEVLDAFFGGETDGATDRLLRSA